MKKIILINVFSLHTFLKPEGLINKLIASTNYPEQLYFIVPRVTYDNIGNKLYDNFFIVEDDMLDKIKKKFVCENDYAFNIVNYEHSELVNYFVNVINQLNEIFDIVSVYTIYENKSLEIVARKYNIPYKHIEQSAIRAGDFFGCTFMWFSDLPNPHSEFEGTSRYSNFVQDMSILVQPFSKEELIMLFARGNARLGLLKLFLNRKKGKSIGIACSVNAPEFCNEWNNEHLIDEVYRCFPDDHVIIRQHPAALVDKQANYLFDNSKNSLEFIEKCEIIISAGSNISFEAMLFGKEVIEIGNFSYSKKIRTSFDKNERCTYDDWYLNYMCFGLYVPIELIVDIEYVSWRCYEKPNENEIFKRNLLFFLNKYYFNDANRILNDNDGLRMDYILKTSSEVGMAWKNSKNPWKSIIDGDLLNKHIYICGTGVDAESIFKLISDLGYKVECFVVGDRNDIRVFCGLNVIHLDEINSKPEETFIIFSQQNNYIIYNLMKKMSKKGYTYFL